MGKCHRETFLLSIRHRETFFFFILLLLCGVAWLAFSMPAPSVTECLKGSKSVEANYIERDAHMQSTLNAISVNIAAMLYKSNPLRTLPKPLGPSQILDPATWCTSNPFLSSWDSSAYQRAAESIISLRSNLLHTTHSAEVHFANAHERLIAPQEQACEPQVRYPPEHDGGKVVCALAKLRSPCVIYSLGSNLNFAFEFSMVNNTACDIFTFDCTVNVAALPILPPRIHFHAICLGEDKTVAHYKSLASIMSQFGHTELALLKMDIEGYEYSVVETIYRLAMTPGAATNLPAQISFEQHSNTGITAPSKAWGPAATLTAGDMALLWVQLTDLGYVVVSRENNPLCDLCVEFTVVRAFC
jgi:hypothetical protein